MVYIVVSPFLVRGWLSMNESIWISIHLWTSIYLCIRALIDPWSKAWSGCLDCALVLLMNGQAWKIWCFFLRKDLFSWFCFWFCFWFWFWWTAFWAEFRFWWICFLNWVLVGACFGFDVFFALVVWSFRFQDIGFDFFKQGNRPALTDSCYRILCFR